MKSFLTLAITLIMIFPMVSCNDCEDCNGTEKEDVPMFQVKSDDVITFGPNVEKPQNIYVIVSSDVTWKADLETTEQGWLTITTEADKIIVNADKNSTINERTGKIIVTPNNDTFKPVEIDVVQTTVKIIEIDATCVMLEFWADYYNNGIASYMLVLGSGDGMYVGENIDVNNGYLMLFDILAEELTHKSYQQIDLPGGTYKNGMDPKDDFYLLEPMTFIRTITTEAQILTGYDGSRILLYEDGEIAERINVWEGDLVVENNNGNYTISAEIDTFNGEKVLINFSGEFNDKLNFGCQSTYQEDLVLSGLNTGTIEFLGEEYSNPGCYHWQVNIETPDSSEASQLLISLFSPMTDTAILDDGTYTIYTQYPYSQFSAEGGYPGFGSVYGTWVINTNDYGYLGFAPLIEGTITVTHNGGDNYTIEMDTFMDNYYTLKASFKGNLEYINNIMPAPRKASYKTSATEQAVPNVGIKDRATERTRYHE